VGAENVILTAAELAVRFPWLTENSCITARRGSDQDAVRNRGDHES